MASGVSYRHFEQGTAYVFPLGSATNPSIQLGDDNARGGYNDGIYGTSAPAVGIALNGTSYFLLSATAHAIFNTVRDNDTVRINSRNYTQATGSAIGFQSKPAQNANGESVIGCEISPRVNSGFTLSGSIIGAHIDAYVKGTAAGTITGDVRGLQIELVTDDAGTRTITGDVTALRIRCAFSATGITGNFQAIKIEIPETQTNSQNYDAVLTLTSNNGLIWRDDYTTEVTTLQGAIKCLVNGNVRYIPLYSGAPVV